MERPRLIALDLDGTLLDEQGRVTQRGAAAIRALTKRGVLIAVATGRPLRMTSPVVHELGLEYGIVFNGAARYRASTRQADYHHALDRETGLEVIARLRECLPDVSLGMETEHGWYLDPRLEERRRSHPRYSKTKAPDGVGDIAGFVRERVVKIFARHPACGADEMAELLQGIDVYATWTLLEMLEVMHPAVNKQAAVEDLSRSLGIQREEVAAFGDQHNDTELLVWAGRGFAVGNASAAVRALADEVTASNTEDGVAEVLERWL